MNDFKLIKTRTEHECSSCNRVIPKGSKANFMQWRAPKFDGDDNQIGIEYVKLYNCEFDDNGECKPITTNQ